MEETKHRCYGCGEKFARAELQYRPYGKGAYRKERYFCPKCDEKEIKKGVLKFTISSFRKSLPARPGYMSHKRW
ncbi:MAG: hypothetical protein P0Y63_03985 [Klebsiella huaxiensis]|uniref:hypothetical protein n=1 Tax=Klebsiella huaxiensis TaxID=2153354 RepID=UPI0026F0A5BB|nr:hypothetical protein [Klebsiella huaxiensis]WEJ90186.1 MAG: hypothetical protein P0Y63_03985 [Klebsiella huaxiensis]